MSFQIICDSACDLDKEYAKTNNVEIVPLSVSYDGETYYKDGVEITSEEFFKKLIDNPEISPKSTLPGIIDYAKVFEKYAKDGIPIICTTISIKFSGSYNAACMAKIQTLEKYPKAKIEVVDSTHNTVCFGLFVNEIVRMKKNGMSFEDALKKIEEIKPTGYIYFTIGSFNYLNKGGRLGKAALNAGDKLGIKPIIVMCNGEISVGGIKRSRKKAIAKVLELVEEHFNHNEFKKEDYNFYVGYCYDKEEGERFKKEVEERMNIKCCKDFKGQIGVVTGVHTGPYALGIGLIKRYDA